MKKALRLLFLAVLILCVSGCVRKPSSYTPTRHFVERQSVTNTPLPNKASMKRQRSAVANTLPSKVQALATRVERAYKRERVSAEDLAEWVNLYAGYCVEYSLSLNKLSDSECESIEYLLGRIAGYIYRDTVSPILEDLDDINEGLEGYEERSQRWRDAAKKGFEEVAGTD